MGPPCLNGQALTNCHYADDTIIFLEAEEVNVENALWAMKAFEALSGIKMNLQTTEMYTIHTDSLHGQHLAQIFGCRLAKFPIKYLGLLLHDSPLRKNRLKTG